MNRPTNWLCSIIQLAVYSKNIEIYSACGVDYENTVQQMSVNKWYSYLID